MKRLSFIFILLIAILCACDNTTNSIENNQFDMVVTTPISRDIFAMDTYMSLKVYSNDETILDISQEKISQLEKLFSVTDENSDLWKINNSNGKKVSISYETTEILQKSLKVCNSTNGALDISIYPVLKEWGFTTDTYQIPTQERIDSLLENVNYKNISLDGNSITIPNDYQIDLGSVAKGYTGDCLMDIFKDNGVQSAIVNLGGNVQTYGTKPDGSLWNVAIKNPFSPNEEMCIVSTSNKAIITSGNYERYFVGDDGNYYWHILDTTTGYPADNGLVSVTIIGDSGVMCDALSTALFVMGTEKAIKYWQNNPSFDMILVSNDKIIYFTQGLKNSFKNISSMNIKEIEYE